MRLLSILLWLLLAIRAVRATGIPTMEIAVVSRALHLRDLNAQLVPCSSDGLNVDLNYSTISSLGLVIAFIAQSLKLSSPKRYPSMVWR